MILDFYISIGLIVVLSTLFQLINIRKINFSKEWYNKYILITKTKPSIVNFRTKEDYDLLKRNNILMIFDFLWFFGLLITQFWKFSLIIIFFNYLTNLISRKSYYNYLFKIFMILRVIIKSMLTILIIINHFLKISLF